MDNFNNNIINDRDQKDLFDNIFNKLIDQHTIQMFSHLIQLNHYYNRTKNELINKLIEFHDLNIDREGIDQFEKDLLFSHLYPPKLVEQLKEEDFLLGREFDADIVNETEKAVKFLTSFKESLQEFDSKSHRMKEQIGFMRENKQKLSQFLDQHFDRIWKIFDNLEIYNQKVNQLYYQYKLFPYFYFPPITKRIYDKPLGHPGDFKLLNDFYDYYYFQKHVGDTTYEKLINHYSSAVPAMCSLVMRKNYFKNKILEISAGRKSGSNMLSVYSGSGRELIEAIFEKKIANKIKFTCFDFEPKALGYIKDQIKKMDKKTKKLLKVEFIHANILGIIRDNDLKQKLKGQDFIYVAGLFDYLPDKTATRALTELFKLLNPGGQLIICNISKEYESHRAYYEKLGDWELIYRTREEMLKWTKNIPDLNKVFFDESIRESASHYHFMVLKK